MVASSYHRRVVERSTVLPSDEEIVVAVAALDSARRYQSSCQSAAPTTATRTAKQRGVDPDGRSFSTRSSLIRRDHSGGSAEDVLEERRTAHPDDEEDQRVVYQEQRTRAPPTTIARRTFSPKRAPSDQISISMIVKHMWAREWEAAEEQLLSPGHGTSEASKESLLPCFPLGRSTGLPLHLACTMRPLPPASFVRKLISAYPDACRIRQRTWGLLPLHLASDLSLHNNKTAGSKVPRRPAASSRKNKGDFDSVSSRLILPSGQHQPTESSSETRDDVPNHPVPHHSSLLELGPEDDNSSNTMAGNHAWIVQLLIRVYPESIYAREDTNGMLPLHIAASTARSENGVVSPTSASVLQVLIQSSPNTCQMVDGYGDTPAVLAWREALFCCYQCGNNANLPCLCPQNRVAVDTCYLHPLLRADIIENGSSSHRRRSNATPINTTATSSQKRSAGHIHNKSADLSENVSSHQRSSNFTTTNNSTSHHSRSESQHSTENIRNKSHPPETVSFHQQRSNGTTPTNSSNHHSRSEPQPSSEHIRNKSHTARMTENREDQHTSSEEWIPFSATVSFHQRRSKDTTATNSHHSRSESKHSTEHIRKKSHPSKNTESREDQPSSEEWVIFSRDDEIDFPANNRELSSCTQQKKEQEGPPPMLSPLERMASPLDRLGQILLRERDMAERNQENHKEETPMDPIDDLIFRHQESHKIKKILYSEACAGSSSSRHRSAMEMRPRMTTPPLLTAESDPNPQPSCSRPCFDIAGTEAEAFFWHPPTSPNENRGTGVNQESDDSRPQQQRQEKSTLDSQEGDTELFQEESEEPLGKSWALLLCRRTREMNDPKFDKMLSSSNSLSSHRSRTEHSNQQLLLLSSPGGPNCPREEAANASSPVITTDHASIGSHLRSIPEQHQQDPRTPSTAATSSSTISLSPTPRTQPTTTRTQPTTKSTVVPRSPQPIQVLRIQLRLTELRRPANSKHPKRAPNPYIEIYVTDGKSVASRHQSYPLMATRDGTWDDALIDVTPRTPRRRKSSSKRSSCTARGSNSDTDSASATTSASGTHASFSSSPRDGNWQIGIRVLHHCKYQKGLLGSSTPVSGGESPNVIGECRTSLEKLHQEPRQALLNGVQVTGWLEVLKLSL